MRLPSFSEMDRAMACQGVAVLPRDYDEGNQFSDRGRAIHWYLSRVAAVGEAAALAEVPEEWRDDCAEIDLSILPIGPEFEREVSVAVDLETGAVRRIEGPKDNTTERYAELGPWEVPGTVDVMQSVAPGVAYVADYKTGWLPGQHVWQLRLAAMAAVGLWEAEQVTAVKIRVRERSREDTEDTWDSIQLMLWRLELLEAARRWRALETVARRDVKPGEHCGNCRSFTACPAKLALGRAIGNGALAKHVGETLAEGANVSPERLGQLVVLLEQADEVISRTKQECYRYAAAVDIPLPDGRVLGMVTRQRDQVDGAVQFRVVSEWAGEEVAAAGVDFKGSKAGVMRSVKLAREKRPELVPARGATKVHEELLERIRARGGLDTKARTSVGIRPARELKGVQ